MTAHDLVRSIAEQILEIPVNGDIPVWLRVLWIHYVLRACVQ